MQLDCWITETTRSMAFFHEVGGPTTEKHRHGDISYRGCMDERSRSSGIYRWVGCRGWSVLVAIASGLFFPILAVVVAVAQNYGGTRNMEKSDLSHKANIRSNNGLQWIP